MTQMPPSPGSREAEAVDGLDDLAGHGQADAVGVAIALGGVPGFSSPAVE
jgi:hypothetical protein